MEAYPTDASANPGAMVVKFVHTVVAHSAVAAHRTLQHEAVDAIGNEERHLQWQTMNSCGAKGRFVQLPMYHSANKGTADGRMTCI